MVICNSLIAQNIEIAYDFPIKPGTNLWNNLTTEEQRIEALQVPDSILVNMTDEAYVETLINFPLYGYYTAFDNNKIGFDVMLTRFNVFDKMCEKRNVGRILLNAYKDANMFGFNKYKSKYKSDLWTIKLNYIEILLSQKDIINSLSDMDKIHLLEAALDKFYSKQDDAKFSSLYGIITTLTILAVDLDNLKGLESIPIEKKIKIHEFMNTSNLHDPAIINYIIELTNEYLKKR